MIDKKQLIEELLDCVKDSTDTETQITALSLCATLMSEALTEQLIIPAVSQQSELLELVTEIANSNQVYSNTRHKLWAKKLISSNCG